MVPSQSSIPPHTHPLPSSPKFILHPSSFILTRSVAPYRKERREHKGFKSTSPSLRSLRSLRLKKSSSKSTIQNLSRRSLAETDQPSSIVNRQSSFVNPPAPPTPHCPRKLPAVPLQSMPLPNRVRWTRDQLLIVLNLYHKLRFGQFDSRQRVIIDLAARLGRTR